MARVILNATSLRISCGCGYKAESNIIKQPVTVLAEAKDHSKKTGHTLTIGGLVKGIKK